MDWSVIPTRIEDLTEQLGAIGAHTTETSTPSVQPLLYRFLHFISSVAALSCMRTHYIPYLQLQSHDWYERGVIPSRAHLN